jgi:hypothetical protein
MSVGRNQAPRQAAHGHVVPAAPPELCWAVERHSHWRENCQADALACTAASISAHAHDSAKLAARPV